MYKSQRRLITLSCNVLLGLVFVFLIIYLIPQANFLSAFLAGVIFFCILLLANTQIIAFFTRRAELKVLTTKETAYLTKFIDKLKFCYSVDDFIELLQSILEYEAGCGLLYVDHNTQYVIYNSADKIASSPETMKTLELNYSHNWGKGIFFIDQEMGLLSDSKMSKGFFLAYEGKHLYVFCRYAKLFDPVIFQRLVDEFIRFEERSKTIKSLSEIAELSSEWNMLAETQKSFLPASMPIVKNLDLAAYFRPLVNVSGDYYTVLPISEHKTLVMLGDVSGKGLAAALVMGLVMNTVKIVENKENLVSMVKAIDRAIKGMHLQDKYTVLFLGIIDTEKMVIRYINASMSDPIVVTQTPAGYKIKPLSSNCSLIGIIELDELEVMEQRLFNGDLILMASDGVSEVMDEDGVELGNTELFLNTIKNSASKSAQRFVEDIVDLVLSYNGNKRLRDDVTMLVAKIER